MEGHNRMYESESAFSSNKSGTIALLDQMLVRQPFMLFGDIINTFLLV